MRSKRRTRERNPEARVIRGLAAAATLALALVASGAKGQEPPAERVSKPGELQSGELKTPVEGPRMTKGKMAPQPVDGKILRMEDELKRPNVPQSGEKQAAVSEEQARVPAQSTGAQKAKGAASEAGEGQVRLVLRLTDSGQASVLSAVEIPGPVVVSNVPSGSFVYEVVSEGQPIAVQAIPDPFELRSFARQGEKGESGHYVTRSKEATISVALPGLTLASPKLSGLSLRVYFLKPGVLLKEINPEVLRQLLKEERVQRQFEIPAAQLAPQIREKAIRPR